MRTSDSPTNIWAVTRSNGTPYVYLRSANWIGAQNQAEEHPEIAIRAREDGGYAFHRMRREEVVNMLKEKAHIPGLPDDFCERGLSAYLHNDLIDPNPGPALVGLRQFGYLPAPFMRNPNLVYVCPREDMDDVCGWAIRNMLNAYRQTETRVQDWKHRFFTQSEMLAITEGTLL